VISVARAAMTLIAFAGLVTVSSPSCSVQRRSSSYACDNTRDCEAGRVCTRGFCVDRTAPAPDECPTECTVCDLDDQTCEIDCSTGAPCPLVTCPPGFSCTILCDAPQGCGMIDCTAGADCDITCTGPGACPRIECGTEPCDVDCEGQGACGFLDCADSCRCDQSCREPGACLLSSCPTGQTEVCTEDGIVGAPCDSFDSRGCDLCP
jgi:hypothetical protein